MSGLVYHQRKRLSPVCHPDTSTDCLLRLDFRPEPVISSGKKAPFGGRPARTGTIAETAQGQRSGGGISARPAKLAGVAQIVH
jgi:hypothetical protein